MNLTRRPPAKLSDLIELAISDAGRLDRTRYVPTWMTWHRPQPGGNAAGETGKCIVCLAGAVIAATLECDTQARIEIASVDSCDPASVTITDRAWRHALRALDSAREGNWVDAFRAVHDTEPDDDLYNALRETPKPVHGEFTTWYELDAHLASLAVRAEHLRKLGA